ncbi:unnamed protein product [Rhizophagus irregularis]|nr:unnamed protein product [Rhizophagus irregularis]
MRTVKDFLFLFNIVESRYLIAFYFKSLLTKSIYQIYDSPNFFNNENIALTLFYEDIFWMNEELLLSSIHFMLFFS